MDNEEKFSKLNSDADAPEIPADPTESQSDNMADDTGDNSADSAMSDVAASTLMKGAAILAVAGIVSKVFGAVFRIPLTNMIGAEGQSYYGAAYPVYQFFYVIATAGFPVAISRMVSERIAHGDFINAHKSYKLALRATLIVSGLSFLMCFFGAGGSIDTGDLDRTYIYAGSRIAERIFPGTAGDDADCGFAGDRADRQSSRRTRTGIYVLPHQP